jgi:hypothetical protein
MQVRYLEKYCYLDETVIWGQNRDSAVTRGPRVPPVGQKNAMGRQYDQALSFQPKMTTHTYQVDSS